MAGSDIGKFLALTIAPHPSLCMLSQRKNSITIDSDQDLLGVVGLLLVHSDLYESMIFHSFFSTYPSSVFSKFTLPLYVWLGPISENTTRWTNAGLMLVQRRRRWANIKTALVQRLVCWDLETVDVRNVLGKVGCLSQQYFNWLSTSGTLCHDELMLGFNCCVTFEVVAGLAYIRRLGLVT